MGNTVVDSRCGIWKLFVWILLSSMKRGILAAEQ